MVSISFMSFSITSVPGRLSILVTSYLVLTNVSAFAIDPKSPDNYTLTALGIWYTACKIFVTLGIAEYATVLYLIRREKKRQAGVAAAASQNGSKTNTKQAWKANVVEDCYLYSWLDDLSWALFSGLYLTFCLAYWIYYMSV